MVTICTVAGVFKNLSNILYGVFYLLSTILLINILQKNVYSTIDWAFLIVYFYLYMIVYIILIAVGLLDGHTRGWHTVHPEMPIAFLLEIITFRTIYISRNNKLTVFCDNHMNNLIFIIINHVLTILAWALVVIFIPWISTVIIYNDRDRPFFIGLGLQSIFVVSNGIFHFIFITNYSYYSVSLFLISVLYIAIILDNYLRRIMSATYSFSISYCLILDVVLLCINMFILRISIEYKSNIHNSFFIIIIIQFVLFLFPNVPCLKFFMVEWLKKYMAENKRYKFIANGKLDDNDDGLIDRLYVVLHTHCHSVYRDESLINKNDVKLERIPFVTPSNNSKKEIYHQTNSMQCFKLQYEYSKLNKKNKWKAIMKLIEPYKTKKKYLYSIMINIYLIMSFILYLLFPMFWFIYFWIYLSLIKDVMNISDLYHIVSAGLFIMYCFLITIFIIFCMIYICRRWKSLFDEWVISKNMILYFKNVSYHDVNINDVEKFYKRQPSTAAILESKCLSFDILFIILTYLFK